MAGRTVNKATDVKEQPKTTAGQGFDPNKRSQPNPAGENCDRTSGQGTDTQGTDQPADTAAMQLHSSVRAGIANTSTAHIQGLANLLKDAEQFQIRAGQQLGQKALRVSQGEPMLQAFVETLNAGMEAHGAPKVCSLPDVHQFIEDLALDAPCPEITPRFYLEPVVEGA